ncbi:MAG: hypothetical protein IID45_13440 [Planctomycetes bacterium]|nr:hypothetical protein [Planctomycetota bacterium]
MSLELLAEVKRFLSRLEAVQQELTLHFERKTIALKSARAPELRQLAEIEKGLVSRLQQNLAEREEILDRARKQGLPAKTLQQLTESIAGGDWPLLRLRIDRARQSAAGLRRESWIHWIVASRTYSNYDALLEIIANRGEAAPVYGDTQKLHAKGGAILDASI